MPLETNKAILSTLLAGKHESFKEFTSHDSIIKTFESFRRASCMYMWDTEEGGPCFLRPTPVSAFDNPGKKQVVASGCILGVNSDGTCNLKSFCEKKRGAYCDENNIIHGGILAGVKSEAVGPVTDDMSEDELESRWVQGFDNQFAFPWEIGMYWKFHVGGTT